MKVHRFQAQNQRCSVQCPIVGRQQTCMNARCVRQWCRVSDGGSVTRLQCVRCVLLPIGEDTQDTTQQRGKAYER